MKTFISTFAAILCAAAFIYGIYAYHEHCIQKEATWLDIAGQCKHGVELSAELLAQDPSAENVEKFKQSIIDLRDVLNRSEFPQEKRAPFDSFSKETVGEIKDFLHGKDGNLDEKLSSL
jgi:hypothetical protein